MGFGNNLFPMGGKSSRMGIIGVKPGHGDIRLNAAIMNPNFTSQPSLPDKAHAFIESQGFDVFLIGIKLNPKNIGAVLLDMGEEGAE